MMERRTTGRSKQKWFGDLKKTAELNFYQTAENREI